MKRVIRRGVLALTAILALAMIVLALRFPIFVKMPFAVVKHESWASLMGLASWVSYLHSYLAQLHWNPETGLKDFETAYRELEAEENPDLLALGKLEWHRGDFAAAVQNIEAYQEANEASEESLFWLAMSHLRLGEAKNCLEPLLGRASLPAHTEHQRMCSLPLDAYHRKEVYSRRAADVFKELLEEHDADNRLYQWLLNFSYMTVNAFPDEVPQQYRIEGTFVDHFYGDTKRRMEEKYTGLRLRDRAPELGVDTLDAGKGVAVEDFDRDGYLDIVTGGSFLPTRFYWNNRGQGFVDRSFESGIGAIKGTHIITAADYDNDGWIDLFISHVFGSSWGGFVLMRNNGTGADGHVTFSTDQSQNLGLLPPEAERTTNMLPWASAWGDLENDGDLDLFVATWAFYNGSDGRRHPNPFANNVASRLYRNDGDRFTDVTEAFGLGPVVGGLNIFGAAFGDYDNDGFADLALTPQWLPGTVLLHNAGGTHFEKTDLIPSDAWGFMTAFVDVNHDGLLDLFVGGSGSAVGTITQAVFGERLDDYNSQSAIWLQKRDGSFENREDFFPGRMPLATMGSNFGDLDNDGALDFYLGTGNPEGWMIVPNLMYMGTKDDGEVTGRMENISMLNGVGTIQKGHGIVFFDFDEDGDQDVYSSLGGMWPGDVWPNQLFVNESELTNTWTKIRLRGSRSNSFGLGARIRVVATRDGGEAEIRHYHMDNKTGFGSAPYLAHIGLSEATGIEGVEVIWPGQTAPEFFAAELETLNLLDEGQGAATLERLEEEVAALPPRD